jgi:hypothetical protein
VIFRVFVSKLLLLKVFHFSPFTLERKKRNDKLCEKLYPNLLLIV